MPQHAGFSQDMFRWMVKEAERLTLPKEGHHGGLILDEMSIQVSFFLSLTNTQ